ncbi:hypothetical protein L2E82_43430 [Cichorium intybus]|uniref:Uncharacterized protein n=1 Tax=Cichorium intybus TaxID=13427 RepID=A0ACB8ZMR2_CICIN|nr:hypothetical protein L2E82_43430 [Cichorium intybus]
MSSSSAARTVNSWCGFTSMLPLLVAPLVDSYGNSYSTVLASSFLYLVAFGADQIDTEDELPMAKSDDKKPDKKSMFFQWWYFGVCSSSLFGMSIMPNIQDSVGWGLGFAMPAMAMAVSIVMFSCGSRFYAYIHDQSNDVKSLEKVVQAVKCSVSKFVHSKTEEKSSLAELELGNVYPYRNWKLVVIVVARAWFQPVNLEIQAKQAWSQHWQLLEIF